MRRVTLLCAFMASACFAGRGGDGQRDGGRGGDIIIREHTHEVHGVMHPAGDWIPCRHLTPFGPLHPAGDIIPCMHTY